MTSADLWVYFYGSYINLDVLAEVGLRPPRFEVARLAGWEIHIAPRANLVPADGATVYGIIAVATHAELERLYAHARDVLGQVYLPRAVLVETLAGASRPALCYIAPQMTPRPAEAAYVDRILGPARRYGFPEWYLERLDSFRPQT